MKSLSAWLYVAGAVLIAVSANSISAIWAKTDNKFSIWLALLLLLSPLVFISFGLVTTKVGGIAIGSGVIDSLLTLSTVLVGLILFHEWQKISGMQYLGIIFALCGIILMIFFPKANAPV